MAVLASVSGVIAGNLTWIGGAGNLLWDNAGNWQPGTAPGSADTVTISGGVKNQVRATLSGADAANTLNIGGTGEPVKTTLVQTQGAGTLTVGTLNLNSGGWLQILAGGHGATPGLAVGTLNIAANGLLDILSNTVTVSDGFTLAGTAQGPGTLISNATVFQTDGKQGVDLLKAPSYVLSGGKTSTGEIDFSTDFDLSGVGRVPDNTTVLVGGAGSTMEQSGTTTMYGVVSGISSYTQSGGDMGGTVTAPSYDLSGGNIVGTGVVNFSDVFTLSDTGVVETGARLVGTAGSTVSQTGGTMSGTVFATNYDISGGSIEGKAAAVDFTLSGDGVVAASSALGLDHHFEMSGGTVEQGARIVFEAGRRPAGEDVNGRMTQTAGTMDGTVVAASYDLSGGSIGKGASVEFSDQFMLSGDAVIDKGAQIWAGDDVIDTADGSAPTSWFIQSGGMMDGDVTADSYTQSGGALGGHVVTGRYDLTDASATSTGATITASTSFTLEPATGTATVDAMLTGTGKLTKSGDGTVILSNGANDFSGGVAVEAGTLDAVDDALPDHAAVTVAKDAELKLSIGDGVTTNFGGAITGADGTFAKDGAGTLNLTGPIVVADLDVDGGTLHVANNALDNTGAVSIAPGGTLQWTVDSGKSTTFDRSMTGAGGDLVKDGAGTLTLGGYVYLGALNANAGTLDIGTGAENSTDEASFDSAVIASGATVYVAPGATLTIRVPNNIVNNGSLINDGTVNDDLDNKASFANNSAYNADLASNTGTIDNNTPGLWTGNILTNAGTITNHGGAGWQGAVKANSGTITNDAGGNWTSGDVDGNIGTVTNQGSWTGDVNGSGTAGYWPGWTYGLIYNDKNAVWTGDINDNNGSVRNVAGTWNGDVVDNHNTVMNDNSSDELDLGYWNGDVVGNHDLVFNAGGGIWTGDVLSNDGTIVSGRASHHTVATDDSQWHGNVMGNAGIIESDAFWYGDVRGNGGTIENTGWWDGDIYAGNTGTIFNAEDDFGVPVYDKIRPTWTGKVKGNAGTILNIGADWTGDIDANTGSISNTRGSYNGFQLGDSTWTGNVVTNAGKITNAAGSEWTGEVEANTGTINTAGTWTGNFISAGIVNAQGTIGGDFTNTGLLHLTGSLAGIGALTNDGTLDMGSGAANTLGAVSASFGSGSFYDVDVNSSGISDKLEAAGTATLAGTVRVTAMSSGGTYDDTTSYTILTAGGGLGGTTFDGVTTSLAFLAPRLSYDADDVYMMLKRNDVEFADLGTTANEKSAAASAESLGAGNPIYDSVLWLDHGQAQHAFDDLAGEGYGATESSFLQNAGLLADVMTGRLDQAFDALGDGGTPSAYAAAPATLAAVTPHATKPETGVWGQIYGARGFVTANAETGGVNASTGGFAAGLDGLAGDWRLGMMLHAGTTVTDMAAVDASSRSADYGVGVYAGTQWGQTRLSLGAGYTRHNVSATREVAFPGFTDSLSASYAANTAEAFGKLSQHFDLGVVSLTPYASLAYVRQETDGFTESGGPAALSSAASLVDATFATLGVGADRKFAIGDGMLLTAKGGLGWRHALGGAPDDAHALADGTSFSVVGAPIAGDTAIVNAGFNLDVSAGNTLDLSYDGQLGLGGQTHVLKGTWAGSF